MGILCLLDFCLEIFRGNGGGLLGIFELEVWNH